MSPAPQNRNLSIDFLRIISMYAICVCHLIAHGGLICSDASQLQNISLTFLKFATLWHVNCFALASGYIYISKEFKLNRIFKIWGLTLFYSVILTGIMMIFYPDTVSWKSLFVSFFPLATNQYWYVTAYAQMFLLIPVFNVALRKTSEGDIAKLLQILALLFCVLSLIPKLGRNFNVTIIKNGYSPVWLSYLYCIGGYWKLYGLTSLFKNGYFEHIKMPDAAFHMTKSAKTQFFLFCSLVVLASLLKISFNSSSLSARLEAYTCPLIFVNALIVMNMCLSHSFIRIERYICFLAPLAFSVYLIHDNNWIRELLIQRASIIIDCFPPLLCVPAVLLAGFALFSLCAGVDFIRRNLFLLFKRHTSSFFIRLKQRFLEKIIF